MHRFRSWTLDPPEWRTQRNRLLPAEGGDGSTLSLDFTTGVLDPRLTFTRTTNATFINSSGLVQYADANYVLNNNDVTASGWSIQNGVSRSFDNSVVNPEGSLGASLVTASSSLGSSAVNTNTFTINGGLAYTVSFWVRAGTATQLLVGVYDISSFTPATAAVISGPGSATGSSSIVVSGLTSSWTRVRLHLSTVNSGSRGVSFYPDAALASGKSVYIWGVKWEAGHVANPTQITTGSSAYYAPRFDYDPNSIGTPRGLLIEGSANNLAYYSESFNPANWTTTGLSGGVVTSTSQTNPAGISSAIRLVEDTANTAHATYQTIGGLTVGNTYTFSVYVRGDGTRTLAGIRITLGGAATDYSVIFDLADGTTGTAYTAGSPGTVTLRAVQHTGGWWRLSVTINAPSANTLFYIYNATTKNASGGLQAFLGTGNGIYVWGAQVETGSGASSYIPTGASTGTRNGENCYMDGANFSSWYQNATAGTMYCEWDHPRCDRNVAHQPTPISLGSYVAGDLIAFSISNYSVGISGYGAIWGSGGTGFQSATVPTSVSVTTGNKSAFAFSGQSVMGGFRSNASALATTTGTVNAKTVLYIGGSGTITGSPSVPTLQRDFMNSCIQRIKFFPTQFTAAQLQSLTT